MMHITPYMIVFPFVYLITGEEYKEQNIQNSLHEKLFDLLKQQKLIVFTKMSDYGQELYICFYEDNRAVIMDGHSMTGDGELLYNFAKTRWKYNHQFTIDNKQIILKKKAESIELLWRKGESPYLLNNSPKVLKFLMFIKEKTLEGMKKNHGIW